MGFDAWVRHRDDVDADDVASSLGLQAEAPLPGLPLVAGEVLGGGDREVDLVVEQGLDAVALRAPHLEAQRGTGLRVRLGEGWQQACSEVLGAAQPHHGARVFRGLLLGRRTRGEQGGGEQRGERIGAGVGEGGNASVGLRGGEDTGSGRCAGSYVPR